MPSARFGFVRRATLRNLSRRRLELELLDGLQNLLPAGVERRFQLEYSTLADAYKEQELDPETRLALFRLASIPADAPEPSESLRATTVWTTGLPPEHMPAVGAPARSVPPGPAAQQRDLDPRPARLLLPDRLADPRGRGQPALVPGGRRRAGSRRRGRDRRACCDRAATSPAQIEQDVAAGTDRLRAHRGQRRRVAGQRRRAADRPPLRQRAVQLHARGHPGRRLPHRRATTCPASWPPPTSRSHTRHRAFLESLPERLAHRPLLAAARAEGDPDLERLTQEYLPLTFSRRHGDPSRPWNHFSIAVRDRAGQPDPRLPGELARHLPELGGAGPIVSRATSRA